MNDEKHDWKITSEKGSVTCYMCSKCEASACAGWAGSGTVMLSSDGCEGVLSLPGTEDPLYSDFIGFV